MQSLAKLLQNLMPTSVRQHILQTLETIEFQRRLDDKWRADSRALDIDARLQPLHRCIHQYAWDTLQRFPNLITPQNFNDRIHWLMLFDQREVAIQCSDKLGVRDFVAERVGSEYLTTLLGRFDTAAEFTAASLPEHFAAKTTHDSGTVFLSTPGSPVRPADIAEELQSVLNQTYGQEKGEWPYAFVTPRILVEELIQVPGHSWAPDIKFHCVDGKVAFIHYICDRETEPMEVIMTPDWERLPVRIYFPVSQSDLPRPHNLQELIRVAEAVAAGFKYLRVDLYSAGDRIIVGETTFFPMSGTYSGYGVYQVHPRMNFDLCTRKPPISDGYTRFDQQPSPSA